MRGCVLTDMDCKWMSVSYPLLPIETGSVCYIFLPQNQSAEAHVTFYNNLLNSSTTQSVVMILQAIHIAI